MDIDSEKKEIARGRNLATLYDQIFDNKYYNSDDGYSQGGIAGILVTNPDNPKNGRIYMFFHMGSKEYGEQVLQYADEYVQKGNSHYPQEKEKRIKVKAGDWIGKVGQRGWALSPHIHFEVFEYFDIVYDLKGKNKINEGDERGYGWKRVDTKSCFSYDLYANYAIQFYESPNIVNAFGQHGLKINGQYVKLEEFINYEFKPQYLKEGK